MLHFASVFSGLRILYRLFGLLLVLLTARYYTSVVVSNLSRITLLKYLLFCGSFACINSLSLFSSSLAHWQLHCRVNLYYLLCFSVIMLLIHAKSHSFFFSQSSSLNQSTGTNQFGFLNVIPMPFNLTPFKSPKRHLQSYSFVILLGLLLSGDIQLNPGPTSFTFNICTLNIHFLLYPLGHTAIFDLADTRNVDVFALTETWITSSE